MRVHIVVARMHSKPVPGSIQPPLRAPV